MRVRFLALPIVLGVGASFALLACKSSDAGLACGTGTEQQGNECVVVPVAGNDAASQAEAAAEEASTPTDAHAAPVFAGVAAVAPVSSTELLATWSAGVEPGNPSADIRYRVYVAAADKPLSYAMPAAITAPGALSAILDNLQPGTAYVVGVRAVDATGIDDGNTIAQKATTATDTKPPLFAGLKAAAAGASGAVTLSWDPAHDDLTPDAALSYLVYESDTAGGEDFTAPVLVSAPGATTATVTRLPNAKQTRYFAVRARDAAGNVDANTVERSATPGADTVAPRFAGCSAATTVSAVTIAVSWTPATDDVSAPADLTYDVFASTKAAVFDFTQPFAVVHGRSVAVLAGLAPATRYSFVCRAKDQAGNEDSNTVEVSATTGADPVPPTFAGLATLVGDPVARTAVLTWAAGMDLVTPQDHLVYDVYVSETAGGEPFDRPPFATSGAGATSITVSNLAPNTTLYFVVRARDADGNRDSNTVEKSMATNASFSLNVAPTLTHDCGVVGCHVPGNPTGGLILAPGFAYASMVGIPAPEAMALPLDGGPLNYVTPGDPGDSFLNIKLNAALLAALKASQPPSIAGRLGTLMPAPSTGSTLTQTELAAIANWIAQGAPNN